MFEAGSNLGPETDIIFVLNMHVHVHVRQFEGESGDIASVFLNKKNYLRTE